jgi:hypothetical protein
MALARFLVFKTTPDNEFIDTKNFPVRRGCRGNTAR